MLTAKQVSNIYTDHKNYWQSQQSEMRLLRSQYMMRYWRNSEWQDAANRVETSRGYELVESYVASLYTRDPSVIVTPDMRARGNPEVARATANDLLSRIRETLEDATRLSLIYPCAFIKLFPVTSPDPLRRIGFCSVAPWNVIVDAASGPGTWEAQRWVGHEYLLPIEEAVARYGNKHYSPRGYDRYIDQDVNLRLADTPRFIPPANNDENSKYILVVEMYDLEGDRLVVWSPDYQEGNKFLFEGISIQVGSTVGQPEKEGVPQEPDSQTYKDIPYRTASGRPVVPIIPLYLSRDPDIPVRGYSSLRRVSDQIREINTMRTYQAQGVRRMARQWLSTKGIFSPEDQAKIAAGIDGEIIEVELSPGQSLGEAVVPFPQVPVPADLERYSQIMDADYARGSVLAPFTRGEATNATATEITALASASSSEIGRMSRARDQAIAEIARVGNIILALILGDDIEPLRLNGQPVMLSSSDLTADFHYYAQDAGATPLADAARRQQLVELAPLLEQLGVPKDRLLSEIVRTFGLPEDFAKPAAPSEVPADGNPIPPEAPPGNEPTTPESLAQMLATSGPSPKNVAAILGGA